MTCSVPICLLLHRLMPDGTEALLMAPDLTTALSDAAQAQAAGEWTAQRITAGRDTLLEGEALRQAIRAKASPKG